MSRFQSAMKREREKQRQERAAAKRDRRQEDKGAASGGANLSDAEEKDLLAGSPRSTSGSTPARCRSTTSRRPRPR